MELDDLHHLGYRAADPRLRPASPRTPLFEGLIAVRASNVSLQGSYRYAEFAGRPAVVIDAELAGDKGARHYEAGVFSCFEFSGPGHWLLTPLIANKQMPLCVP